MYSHEHCACVVTECCVNLYIMLSVLGNSNTGGQSIEYSIFYFVYSEKKNYDLNYCRLINFQSTYTQPYLLLWHCYLVEGHQHL